MTNTPDNKQDTQSESTKPETDINSDADSEKGNVANAQDQSKTFDMYHVKNRMDLVFLLLFVLVMILVFLFAIFYGGGAEV